MRAERSDTSFERFHDETSVFIRFSCVVRWLCDQVYARQVPETDAMQR